MVPTPSHITPKTLYPLPKIGVPLIGTSPLDQNLFMSFTCIFFILLTPNNNNIFGLSDGISFELGGS